MSQDPYTELPQMAQPLGYSGAAPDHGRRPGILTAVGITSIVLAVLAVGTAGFIGIFGFAMYMSVKMTRAMATPAPVAVVAQSVQLPATTFTDVQPMNPAQQAQLRSLLEDHADEVAGADQSPGFITDHGSKAGADGQPLTYFATRTGRIELFDDHGTFVPTSGYPIRRVDADVAVEPTTNPAKLSDRQIDKVLARTQTLCGNGLNTKQVEALKAHLQADGQQLIPMPNKSPELFVSGAYKQPDGSVIIVTNTGSLTLSATGSTIQFVSYSTRAMASSGPMSNLNESAALLTIVMSVLNAGLSIYLLIIGIFVLSDSRYGRTLHKIYAWVKLLAVAGAGVVQYVLITSLMQSAPVSSTRQAWVYLTPVIGIAVGSLYPIALLIIFGTRRVREYYSANWIGNARY